MITTILTALLAIFYFLISVQVISNRKRLQVSLGNGEDNEILKYTSAHNNFASYAPMLIILFYFNETSGLISNLVLIPLALMILTGRIFHYKGLTAKSMNFSLRVKGMKLTLFSLLVMAISLLVIEVYKVLA